jgi:UDP-3-O-[3-hydroxymyristoyl] glucosamine N-acyltransferase
VAEREFRLEELAQRIGGRVEGDAGLCIRGIATLDQAGPHELSFLTNRKYRKLARTTRAGALLVPPDSGLTGVNLLESREPYLALSRLLELFHPAPQRRPEVSPQAWISAEARIGREVAVGPFAVIEAEVRIEDHVRVGAGAVVGEGCHVGEGTELRPKVVLYPGTRVGAQCLIHAGVVLGGDGFGFASTSDKHHKVPQLGTVVVEDDVEIGANSTVDRGTLGETVVGQGSKIDNLVMLAHGVRVGPGALLAAQSGIAGSTTLGARTTFAGQAGAAGHLNIADGCVVAAKSAVFNDLERGSFVAGVPAVDHRVWKRAQALTRRLPDLQKKLRELERRLQALEQSAQED